MSKIDNIRINAIAYSFRTILKVFNRPKEKSMQARTQKNFFERRGISGSKAVQIEKNTIEMTYINFTKQI